LPAAVCLIALSLLLPIAASSQQQQRSPHAGFIYPAGAQKGAEVDVKIGGQFLIGATGIYVSGEGVTGTLGEYFRPPNGKEMNELREKFRNARLKLVDRGLQVPAQPAMLLRSPALADMARELGMPAERLESYLRYAVARQSPKTQINPQLQEWLDARITVDANAEPGVREMRVVTRLGLSNPIRFEVGRYAEARRTQIGAAEPAEVASLPVVLNGQILPGEAHRYRFTGRKGMRFVAAISAESLLPYLADAVPGWFQPRLSLFGPEGREIASADHFQFRVDPILLFNLPADGQYTLEVRDTLYRGREDFVYRVTMGELPVVTSVFPLGGRTTGQTAVETRGWNLPQAKEWLDGRALGPGVHAIELGGIDSEDYKFQVGGLPECFRKPPDAAGRPQPIPMPVVINGCIRNPGETDAYRFTARAGQTIVAEVMARRLGSELDSILSLTDGTGRQIAYNDDFEDKAFGLLTHQSDSRIVVTLPRTGAYVLRIRDAANKGGDEYGYRLRVSPPIPDFELRIVPSSITIRAGMTIPLTVYAIRRDGFDGDIALSLKNPPKGVVLRGGRILAGKDQQTITLTAPMPRLLSLTPLQLEGAAQIDGRQVTRSVVPADDMMQAFAYHHLVPARELVLDVLARGAAPRIAAADDQTPLRLISGGVTQLRLMGIRGPAATQVQFALDSAPDGISIKSVATDGQDIVLSLQAEAPKVKPGSQGYIIVSAYRDTMVPSMPGSTKLVKRRQSLGVLPAIEFAAVSPGGT
jgi:hypothetical protein